MLYHADSSRTSPRICGHEEGRRNKQRHSQGRPWNFVWCVYIIRERGTDCQSQGREPEKELRFNAKGEECANEPDKAAKNNDPKRSIRHRYVMS